MGDMGVMEIVQFVMGCLCLGAFEKTSSPGVGLMSWIRYVLLLGGVYLIARHAALVVVG